MNTRVFTGYGALRSLRVPGGKSRAGCHSGQRHPALSCLQPGASPEGRGPHGAYIRNNIRDCASPVRRHPHDPPRRSRRKPDAPAVSLSQRRPVKVIRAATACSLDEGAEGGCGDAVVEAEGCGGWVDYGSRSEGVAEPVSPYRKDQQVIHNMANGLGFCALSCCWFQRPRGEFLAQDPLNRFLGAGASRRSNRATARTRAPLR